MSDTPSKAEVADSEHSARRTSDQEADPGQRKHRTRRVVLISFGTLLAVAIAATIGIYAYVNHVASSIPRVHVGHLAAGGGQGSGETFLITGSKWQPNGTPVQGVSPIASKLIMLLHLNADGRTGGVVTIPADAMVAVPGFGTKPLWYAAKVGGPSLLVLTVSQLTGVPINHFAAVDLDHVTSLVDAIGGVNVTLSASSIDSGHLFTAGVNQLTGITASYYAFDQALSDNGEMLRQENLLRAILDKIGNDHLLIRPFTAIRVLNAITRTMTVDSNLTNSEIESLARKLGGLGGNAATFVTAPTLTVNGELVLNTAVADQLWKAIRQNSIAKFARAFPATVTPDAVP
jgi:LCP family protein required for cell wall assembly